MHMFLAGVNFIMLKLIAQEDTNQSVSLVLYSEIKGVQIYKPWSTDNQSWSTLSLVGQMVHKTFHQLGLQC